MIEVVENVSGMKSLAELNLRKNKITQIKDLANLPSL
jgi:Leucine-rich repeat (LRR) protein